MSQVRLVAGVLLALLVLSPIPATATAATPAVPTGPADATSNAPVGEMACTLSCSAWASGGWADAGETISLYASVTPTDCTGSVVFDWDFGDGSPHSGVEDPTHVYTGGGEFTWTMTATVDGQTCTKTGTLSVCGIDCSATVPATGRAGARVSFSSTATATGCFGWAAYDWDFGDGTSHADWSSPQHAYAAPGTYTWTLRVTAPASSASCERSGTITIAEAVACTDCQVTVPATGEAGAPVSVESHTLPADCSATVAYRFDFGDGSGEMWWGTGDHTYCAPGSYTWTATVTIGGTPCVRTGTIAIGPPTALECSASVTQAGACPLEASYYSGAGACSSQAAYAWDFGDGTTSTSDDGKHVYPSQGSYTWTATVVLAGGTCTGSGVVTVSKPQQITAVATASPRSGTPPLPVSFSGGVEPATCIASASYFWELGDGSTSTEPSPSHTYAAAGLYTWKLTVTAEGLTAARRGAVVVSDQAPTWTWAPQLSGTTNPIVDVHFTGDLQGWTAAQRGLRRTANGGRTWWTDPINRWCYGVRFLDADIGFYTGSCGFSRTVNRGSSWSGFWYDECWGFRFTDVFPTSPTQVWLSDSSGDLWRWTYTPGAGLAGRDWTLHEFTSTGAGDLQAIWFTDADNGWGVGAGGVIVRIGSATSAAPSFATQASGTAAVLRGIVMLTPTAGWVVGDSGTILFTTDGGATWSPRASGTPLHLRGVDLRDASNGWIVGEGGLVLATADGGATWTPEVTPTDAELRSVSAPAGGSHAYAGGTGGTLLKRIPLVCPGITVSPDTLPDGATSRSYSQTLSATGGAAPYSFGIAAGALPPGIALAADGTLSGYPTAPASSSFTARAVDADSCSGDRPYDMAVACDFTCSAWAYQRSSLLLTASFLASATTACGPVAYLWTFGDGTTATEEDPTHAYAAPGTYAWTFTVTSGEHACAKSGTVEIKACAVTYCNGFGSPSQGSPPLTVAFSGHGSTNGYCFGDPTYSWDFGDGASSVLEDPTHVYETTGAFHWTFTASADGVTCSDTGTVTVQGPCTLTCSTEVPATAEPGEGVFFSATAVATDCGSPMYDWDFGDGTAHGAGSGYYHAYAAPGTYTWSLTVTADGQTCSRSGTITVCALTCTATVPATGYALVPVSFQSTATPSGCADPVTYEWSFGDASPDSPMPSCDHAYATTGTFAWTLTARTGDAACRRSGTIRVGSRIRRALPRPAGLVP